MLRDEVAVGERPAEESRRALHGGTFGQRRGRDGGLEVISPVQTQVVAGVEHEHRDIAAWTVYEEDGLDVEA